MPRRRLTKAEVEQRKALDNALKNSSAKMAQIWESFEPFAGKKFEPFGPKRGTRGPERREPEYAKFFPVVDRWLEENPRGSARRAIDALTAQGGELERKLPCSVRHFYNEYLAHKKTA